VTIGIGLEEKDRTIHEILQIHNVIPMAKSIKPDGDGEDEQTKQGLLHMPGNSNNRQQGARKQEIYINEGAKMRCSLTMGTKV
jgi:hypothetical protein